MKLNKDSCYTVASATLVVAASDSLHKERADYVCPGVDDQAVIHAAFDALPSGGEVALLEGTFYTAKEIRITNKDNWILSGSGKATRIITNAKFESDLSVDASSGATTVTVDSVVGFREGQRVIIVDDSSDISLDAASGGWDEKDILAISGNVISFATGLSQDYTTLNNSKVYTAYDVLKVSDCNNVQIRDLYLDGNSSNQATGAKGRNSHAGINLIRSSNSSIDKVYISNCPNLAIRLDEGEDIVISNCFLSSSLRGMCAYGPSRRITVLGTHSTGHSENGLRLCLCHDSLFIGNHLYGNTLSGFTIAHDSSNNTITGNYIYNNCYGLITDPGSLYLSKNCNITNNIIHGNSQGIFLKYTSDYILSGNLVFDNDKNGILLGTTDCNNVLITGNFIKDNNLDEYSAFGGIRLDPNIGNGNIISNNRISGAKQDYGIVVLTGNTNTQILENVLTDNRLGGVSDVGTSTVIRNNIGYTTKNSSSSTGTGAQQTIAHGLAATPTKIILWNIEDGANPYQSAAADGTNIKITAVINQDYGWEAEVV